ncbi:MAG TPA: sugar porter family MFS transporter [Nocardioidaceae bacterium]|jgi:sugar porter (SP) family MFS transporter|nr:sugar porter family MFS transporter [Nocardioidaceae bacterium]
MTTADGSEQLRGQGVLAGLDTSGMRSFYWYLALLACIGGFLFGYDTAVIGSVLDFVPYHLSSFATGYLVAGASLGAAIGALAAGPLTDRFGRKSLLMADATIYAVGAILSAVTINAGMLLGARTLIGLAVGADSAIATAYIAEFAPAKRRGQLGLIQQWMITVGILVSYLIALLVFHLAPGAAKGADWRLILGLGAVPAIVAIALRARMPESPRWLLHKGRFADAAKALGQLGVNATEDEARRTAEELEANERRERRQRRRRWTPGVKRALLVVSVFFVFQQITGINVPFYYGPQLLGQAFKSPGATALEASMAGLAAAAILGAVNVVATYFGFRWIDKIGRRPLALGGYVGMTIFMLVAAVGIAFLTGLPKQFVVMIGFSLFITSFAIGVGGTGWLIQGEVFPTSVRGTAASIGASVDWIANFAVILVFPIMTTAIGLPWVMVVLAGLAVVAFVFVSQYLPETRHLSVEQVVEVFEQQQGASPTKGRRAAGVKLS